MSSVIINTVIICIILIINACVLCIDGTSIFMCPCMLLANLSVSSHWIIICASVLCGYYVCVQILTVYRFIP